MSNFANAIGSWNGPFFGIRRACLAAVLDDTMLATACVINDMTVHALVVAHLGPQNLLVEEVLRARARAIGYRKALSGGLWCASLWGTADPRP